MVQMVMVLDKDLVYLVVMLSVDHWGIKDCSSNDTLEGHR
jgi:hypothetical protein